MLVTVGDEETRYRVAAWSTPIVWLRRDDDEERRDELLRVEIASLREVPSWH